MTLDRGFVWADGPVDEYEVEGELKVGFPLAWVLHKARGEWPVVTHVEDEADLLAGKRLEVTPTSKPKRS